MTNLLRCIVHFEKLLTPDRVKPLSEINKQKLREAKEKRLQLGGAHIIQQVHDLPDDLSNSSYGVHLDPCYKRY